MPTDIYSGAVGVEHTPAGRRLVVSRVVDATADEAWDVLTDTTRWPTWGPSIAAVDCPSRYIAAGTTGRVRLTAVGLWVSFEVDSYVDTEAEKRWTWAVGGVPATGHRVDPLDGQCRVSFEVPLVAAGYVPVCRRALDEIAALVTGDDGRERARD